MPVELAELKLSEQQVAQAQEPGPQVSRRQAAQQRGEEPAQVSALQQVQPEPAAWEPEAQS